MAHNKSVVEAAGALSNTEVSRLFDEAIAEVRQVRTVVQDALEIPVPCKDIQPPTKNIFFSHYGYLYPLNLETLRETVDDAVYDAVYELRLAVKGLTDAVCKLKTERTVNVDRHGNMSRA